MCLCKVKKVKRLTKPLRCYKACFMAYNGEISTAVQGTEIRIGMNTAEEPDNICLITPYKLGFHCYTNKKDVKEWTHDTCAVCEIPAGTEVTFGEEVTLVEEERLRVVVSPVINVIEFLPSSR